MQSGMHTGRARVGIPVALTALSLVASAVITSSQAQERSPAQERPTDPSKTASITVDPQNVSKAVADLRKAVLGEFEKAAFLQGKPIDSSKLLITTADQNAVIAGAPITSRAGLGGVTDPNRPDPARPTDPNRSDPNQVATASAMRDDVIGVVLFSGHFAARMEGGQPKEEVKAGTYLVKRGSTGQNFQLVDANERVVATVPLLAGPGRDIPTREIGKDPLKDPAKDPLKDPTKDPGQDPGAPKKDPLSTDPARASAGQTTTVPMAGSFDWDRVYMSILHHFEPKFG